MGKKEEVVHVMKSDPEKVANVVKEEHLPLRGLGSRRHVEGGC